MKNQQIHVPVMLNESLDALSVRDGGVYFDGTFGGGGHSKAILDASHPSGKVVACDLDPLAIDRGRAIASALVDSARLLMVHDSFSNLDTILRSVEINQVDGILLDLGLSSFQLADAEKGFSFQVDRPLDMRFDPTRGESAGDLVNRIPERELRELLWTYGEERRGRRIAAAIVSARESRGFQSTSELAEVVEQACGGRRGERIHPATRTFQALRIAVNDELGALEHALEQVPGALAPGGRLVVISFHSLEDRIVKQWIQRESTVCVCPPAQPICTCNHRATVRKLGRPIRASAAEIDENTRSRSAIMRVAERLRD